MNGWKEATVNELVELKRACDSMINSIQDGVSRDVFVNSYGQLDEALAVVSNRMGRGVGFDQD